MARRIDDSDHVKEYDVKEHKIMAMEEKKRERIIEAALLEFSKGYTAANTDAIVNVAEISKGLLFHYFGSKRGLFLFLIKYALDAIVSACENTISESNDFLENLRIISKVKADMSFRHPDTFGFMIKAMSAMTDVFPEGLPADLPFPPYMWMRAICQKSNNDEALFKEGIDGEKAQNIIIWTTNGLIGSLLRYGDDVDAYRAHYDELAKEIEAYMQLLRKILYR